MMQKQETQEQGLRRVSAKLGEAIVVFCKIKGVGGEFFADELRSAIDKTVGQVAPDSPGRILRMLRKEGRIDYEVVNRRASHYRITKL